MISGPIEIITESERKKLRIHKLRVDETKIYKMRIKRVSVYELEKLQEEIVRNTLKKKAKTMRWIQCEQDKPHCLDLYKIFLSFTIVSDKETLETIKVMEKVFLSKKK